MQTPAFLKLNLTFTLVEVRWCLGEPLLEAWGTASTAWEQIQLKAPVGSCRRVSMDGIGELIPPDKNPRTLLKSSRLLSNVFNC
jgi:hypothetical protein